MDTKNSLFPHLQPGGLYRRSDLVKFSKSIDRDLANLVNAQVLVRVWRGVYEYPKRSRFGLLPPDPGKLVNVFLQTGNFLIVSPNDFNALGLGTTQLYNCLWVYNHKRQCRLELGGQVFEFRMRPNFPKEATPEFLLAELLNNLDSLAEDRDAVRTWALKKL